MKYDNILYLLYRVPENNPKNVCILPLFAGFSTGKVEKPVLLVFQRDSVRLPWKPY